MENRENLIIELYQSGCSQAECARKAYTNVRTVKKVLNKNNIHIRTSSEASQLAYSSGKKKKGQTPYTQEQEQIVLDCYVNQKRGLNYCKSQSKVSLATLNQIL